MKITDNENAARNILIKSIILLWCYILVCAFGAISCTINSSAYKEIETSVYQDDFQKGIEAIKKSQEGNKPIYAENNAVALFLDMGLLEHYAGRYAESSRDLQEAERLIEEAFTKSITANMASYILNDNTKAYPGEDYEDIYLNVFNALNYYNRGDLEGAMVEIRKISMSNGKLDLLSRKYENVQPPAGSWMLEQLKQIGHEIDPELPPGKAANFSNSALARYLCTLFYLGSGKIDDARIEFEQLKAAFDAQPGIYKNPLPASALEAMNTPKGKARLNIIAFTGLSPAKTEGFFQHFFPFFKYNELRRPVFRLPKFASRNSGINSVEITIGKDHIFSLDLLEDMGAVMEETFNARFSNLFFKTYIRTLLKYAAADVTASSIEKSRSSLAARTYATLTKLAIDASEGADIRMARFLPDKAYIGGINLDPGTYTVTVNYYSGRRIIAREERFDIRVSAETLNLIEFVSLK